MSKDFSEQNPYSEIVMNALIVGGPIYNDEGVKLDSEDEHNLFLNFGHYVYDKSVNFDSDLVEVVVGGKALSEYLIME